MLPASVVPDRVDHEVDAPAVGEPACLVGEVVAPVVDAMVEAVLDQAAELVVARRRGEHGRTGPLGQLDRGQADAAGAGLHEHRLTRLQVAELEQAVVGGAERDRHARRLDQVEAVGHQPRDAGRQRHQLGVRPVRHRAHHPLADGAVGDAVARPRDRAAALVADDVRCRRHRPAEPVEGVAPLDADRLDLRRAPARRHLGSGTSSYRSTSGAPVS